MGMAGISFKAYDNVYRIPMGICLSIGLSVSVSGAISAMPALVVIGVIFLILFLIFKCLNYAKARKEIEEEYNVEKISIKSKREVNSVLESRELTSEQKLCALLALAERGNKLALAMLTKVFEEMDE